MTSILHKLQWLLAVLWTKKALASQVKSGDIIQTPEVGQLLQVQAGATTTEDSHAVATVLNGEIVARHAHMPRKISRRS